MRLFSLSFHCGPAGNHTGIGQFIRDVLAAGFKASIKSVDHYGHLAEWHGNDDVIKVFRLSAAGQADSYDYDVPNYNISPYDAAKAHFEATIKRLPPEFEKDQVWLEVINEVDKNRAAWLGQFAQAITELAITGGYKVLLFGFSSGEPEPSFWREPSVIDFLRYCEEFPNRVGVSLHEYQFEKKLPLSETYPHHYGRFLDLFDICDEYEIKWPTVYISECGYELGEAPPYRESDMLWALNLYGRYENILGAALWCLQSYQGRPISNQVNAYLQPLGDLARRWTPPTPVQQAAIPPSEQTFEEAIEAEVEDKRKINFNALAALERKILEDGYTPFSAESRLEWDDGLYAVQGARKLGTEYKRAYYAKVGDWGNVRHVYIGDIQPVIDEPDDGDDEDELLEGLVLGPLLDRPYVYTSFFGDKRNYWGIGHEGIDADVIGLDPDSEAHVLCVHPGRVTKIYTSDGYGLQVHVESEHNGTRFICRYAHLDDADVRVGDWVKRGAVIGEIGDTGNVTGEHLHFNLEVPNKGLSGYIVPDVIDPQPFLPPPNSIKFEKPGLLFDMSLYLFGDGRLYEVRHSDGSQSRFQSQREGKIEYQTKGIEWEEMWLQDAHIYRGADTSPGGGRFYVMSQSAEGGYGAPWIPLSWRVGDSFTRDAWVTFYNKSDGSIIYGKAVTDTMTFIAHHSKFIGYNDVEVADVIELLWSGGERYFYARGFGLVGWGREHYDPNTPENSRISEIHAPGARPDNVREKLSI